MGNQATLRDEPIQAQVARLSDMAYGLKNRLVDVLEEPVSVVSDKSDKVQVQSPLWLELEEISMILEDILSRLQV